MAWPLAGVLSAAAIFGAWSGMAAGLAVSISRFGGELLNAAPIGRLVDGTHLVSTLTPIVLFVMAGASVGYLVSLLRTAESAVAAARAHDEVARTLHDGVLQTLAVVERQTSDPALARMAREQERDLRSFLRGDGHARPGTDLVGALRTAADRFERAFGGRVDVLVAEDVPTLSADCVGALAGAVGEAMTNAGKHGAATRVTVYVEPDENGADGRRRPGVLLGEGRRDRVRPGRGAGGDGDHPLHPGPHGRGGRAGRARSPAGGRRRGQAVGVTAPIRLVLADDHPIWRAGVRADLGAAFHRGGRGVNHARRLAVIRAERPDLAVCDLHMPGGGGLTAGAGVRCRPPGSSCSPCRGRARPARRGAAGAIGYLVKSTPPDELGRALRRAAAGEPVFSPALAALVLGEFRALAKAAGGNQPLSDREREVLQLVARGHVYKEIGAELFIAEKTVENHVRNILAKLHLSRKQELIRYAVEHGIE